MSSYNPFDVSLKATVSEIEKIKGKLALRAKLEAEATDTTILFPLINQIGLLKVQVEYQSTRTPKRVIALKEAQAKMRRYKSTMRPEWFKETIVLTNKLERLRSALKEVERLHLRFEMVNEEVCS